MHPNKQTKIKEKINETVKNKFLTEQFFPLVFKKKQ